MSALVVLTYTRVRSARHLPAFLRLSVRSVAAARSTPGNTGVRIVARTPLAWYTMTAWDDEDAMAAFVGSPAHREAMRATRRLTTATRFDRITIEGRLSETRWRDAYQRLDPTVDQEPPPARRRRVRAGAADVATVSGR